MFAAVDLLNMLEDLSASLRGSYYAMEKNSDESRERHRQPAAGPKRSWLDSSNTGRTFGMSLLQDFMCVSLGGRPLTGHVASPADRKRRNLAKEPIYLEHSVTVEAM